MSSEYLRLLISNLAILIPACASSSPAFLILYSAYMLNKQIWCTLFSIWNQSLVSCSVVTVASWPGNKFLRRQVRWSRWQIDGETMRYFIFFWGGEGIQNQCIWLLQPWNKNTLTPWKESYDQPRQHIKKQRHYFANKGPSIEGMAFTVVIMDVRVGL